MSTGRFGQGFFGLVLAAVLLVSSPQARAAIFVGALDPDFGNGFTNLGFRGEATFVIPDACLATTGIVNPGDSCWQVQSNAYLQSLFIEFYDSSASAPQPTLLTVNFGAPDVSFPVALDQFYIAFNPMTSQNELFSVDVGPVGPQSADLSSLFPPAGFPSGFYPSNAFLTINFVLDTCGECDLPEAGAFLTLASENPDCDVDCSFSASSAGPAGIVFRQVPEPGTLSLLLGALSATLLTMRRRGQRF